MKKSILLSTLLLLMNSLAFSQGYRNMSPEERAKRDTEQLKGQLGLTDDQADEAYKINLKNAEEIQKVFSTSTGDRETMRKSMQKIRQKRDSSYQEILTDYQFEQYRKIMEERMEQRRQRVQGEGNP
jgi:biopolymer transport protein ExbB/TolQ